MRTMDHLIDCAPVASVRYSMFSNHIDHLEMAFKDRDMMLEDLGY